MIFLFRSPITALILAKQFRFHPTNLPDKFTRQIHPTNSPDKLGKRSNQSTTAPMHSFLAKRARTHKNCRHPHIILTLSNPFKSSPEPRKNLWNFPNRPQFILNRSQTLFRYLFSYIIYIWLISHLLAMSHCTLNPIIYCWMNNKFRNGFKHIYFSVLGICGLTSKLNLNGNGKAFQPSVHNYSIQTQYTQRRPFHQNRLKQLSNDGSNNSNEPVDIELALVSDNNNNAESSGLEPSSLKKDEYPKDEY